ncbi:L-fuculose-phosphate aldolase [Burkholderiales bacterium]|nr:MAG: class II aldolase [Burkholderiales bacterium]CAG1011659.1 L-fuculose-phosphate aldolase [Burkholderiales bacterium]
MNETSLRAAIVATAQQLNPLGINHGKAGNVSARWGEGFLVTPSGLPYERTTPEDLVYVDAAGHSTGLRRPSSEWRFHRDIYAHRADAQAVVHAHSTYATTLACLRRGIPPLHYMIALAGGTDIRCSAYATFGTQALSDAALEALQDRRACLLANHGQIALGASLDAALALAVEVEHLAQLYWRALQVGEPVLLTEAEMAEAQAQFQHYRPAT